MGDALNLANVLQMIRKCLQVWNMLMWSLPKAFIKYNHMDHKIRKGKVGMGENNALKWVVVLKIHDPNENQICQ